jgi:hydrogenase maturation protease
MKKLLIAGIGNIFMGDDAFGVEVVQQLSQRPLPSGVKLVDFGIRSYDLAYALTDGYSAVILVDAMPKGELPGTLYLVEPEIEPAGQEKELPDAHSLNPVQVLRLAASLGELPPKVFLVGCEPLDFGPDEGHMGLSDPVKSAVPDAIGMIESLVSRLLELETRTSAGLAPV